MSGRLRAPALALSLALALGLSACTSPAPQGAAPLAGGSASVPGDLPPGTSYAEVSEGVPAPESTLHLLDGTTLDLADFHDRPVVLVFFASWCQWCTDNQEGLNELASSYGDTALFVGVTGTDGAPEASAYLEEHAVPYPVALDPELTVHRAFAVDEPPLVAVVAPGGHLVKGWPGGTGLDTLGETLASFGPGEE